MSLIKLCITFFKENTMQHKIKILTTLLAATLSFNCFAAQQVLDGKFTTIKAVSISEVTPIAFAGLTLTNGSSCDMTASADGTGTGYLGDVAMRLGAATVNAAGSTVNTMDVCVGSTTPAIGVYEIDGASGANVTITITNGPGTEVAVAPAGCVGNYVAGVDGDSCVVVADGTTATIRLAGATDTGSLGEGTPLVGTSLIALGGTVTANQTLTAGTPYTADFTIDVAY